ncbi:hypothetical protein PybrP1_000991 [[Pythium] brassicae (nom. inval.)]|nr:hypothetical protein PybrP1_000991 [[Pythium] brassicae (nom. inval.)]
MGGSRREDKVSIIQSDSLQQKRNLKLNLGPSDEPDDDAEKDESETHLLGARNLYIDSPRVGLVDEDLTDAEVTRRKRVGMATVLGLFLSVVLCVLFMKYLSAHESFSALPPTQQRFMAATTAKGAKENLEQYTAGNRHTGSSGDYEMAKYIRSKAIDFGIEDNQIKLDEFEILMNEPEALRIELGSDNNATSTVFDLMASYKTKKNARMPNGSATGKLVFANYGSSKDYDALAKANVSVTGAIVLVRIGDISLPAKIVLAGKYGAAGVITYNDPSDDGAAKGEQFPDGPWRVSDQASFGSVYMGNGDPSTPDGFSATAIDRISVDEVFSENNTYNILPTIASMPVSAKLAKTLLQSITAGQPASEVFDAGSWATPGGLGIPYSVGASDTVVSMENRNKYAFKKVWNLLITIKGSREGDRYVIVGSQRDSLNAGAVSPGSGNAVFIEMLRAVGDLLTNGWVPHRTLLFASFGGEQFGSVGSSEWIDRHFSHLGGRGIIYMNLRDVVRGAGPLDCEAAASLRKNIYLMSAEVHQPKPEVGVDKFFAARGAPKRARRLVEVTKISEKREVDAGEPTAAALQISDAMGDDTSDDEPDIHLLPLNTTFNPEDLPDSGGSVFSSWLADTRTRTPSAKLPKVDLPGSGNRMSPFLARLGIPTMELSFDGDYYGVEHSANDTVEWVKKFADPSFSFHRAAAQLYGSVMLSFSDAIFLQYDFTEVARDLRHGEARLADAVNRVGLAPVLSLTRLGAAIAAFEAAAVAVTTEMRVMSDQMLSLLNGELIVDLKRVREMNTRLLMTEKAFLLPAGLPHMPWLKHALYGISEWDDFRVGYYPGVTHELKRGNPITIKRELTRLCQTIEQAADTLSTTVL